MTRIEVSAGQMQFLSLCFCGAGAPFVNDLSLVEPLYVGPADTGAFMATGTGIMPSKSLGLIHSSHHYSNFRKLTEPNVQKGRSHEAVWDFTSPLNITTF